MSVGKDRSKVAASPSVDPPTATLVAPETPLHAFGQSQDPGKVLFETTAQGVLCYDDSGVIVTANCAAERILGLPLDQMLGRTTGNLPWQTIHEDGSAFDSAEHPGMVAMTTGREVRDVVMGLVDPSGARHKWLSISAVPVFRPGKSVPVQILVVLDDITERKRAEQLGAIRQRLVELVAVRSLDELLQNALDEIEHVTGSQVAFYHFVEADQQTLSLQSWSTRTVAEFCTAAGKGQHYDVAQAGVWVDCVHQRRPVVHNDYASLPHKKGLPEGHATVIREGTVVPILRGDKIVAILGVGNKATDYTDDDVTIVSYLADVAWEMARRKIAEEGKARLEAQLEQNQRMDSIGRFAGGVAHDFNNMLGVILGHAELALQQVDSASPLHVDLEQIRQAATRTAHLTRQLLAFARRQVITPKVLDLNESVAGMLQMLRRLVGESIELAWLPGKSLWPVKVDPSQIDQILANLCVNARDAIAGAGRVTIETGTLALDDAYCSEHAGFIPGEYVRLAVSDTGSAIDKQLLPRIFEPFFTSKGIGRGTGLGLATVYGIVKQNRGLIDVDSEPALGTTFTIYLPRHADKTVLARTDAGARSAAPGPQTILLVDQEPAILKLATVALEGQGYTVLAARTPAEAIRLAREYPREIHMLLTDVAMPEMNGRDLARKLLLLHPRLGQLFMSGYSAESIAHHGALDEGASFIQKPFSMEALAAKVRDVIRLPATGPERAPAGRGPRSTPEATA